jgi:TonB family protein
MITPLLILRLTLVLALTGFGLAVCRKLEARYRHSLCITAVLLALQLPWLSAFAKLPLPLPAGFTVAVRSAGSSSHTLQFPWIHALWLTGILLVVVRYAAGLLYLVWQTRKAAPYYVTEPGISLDLNAAGVSVRIAPISAPLVWGWVNPVILLPEEASTWSPEHVRLALLHELAHVQRKDLWTSLLWIPAKAIYWFHPLVWWLSVRAREEQELACDARVLQAGASPAEYAGLLVDIARHVHSPAVLGCAMVTHPNLLRGRIMHILQSRPRSSSGRSLISLLVSLGLMASAAILAIAAPDHPTASNDQQIYKIGGDVSSPRVISKIEPEYSDAAKSQKIQGGVLLNIVIDAAGVPHDIRVMRSLDPDLDANAVQAVTEWRFSPAMKGGKPVACEAKVQINFHLL